MGFLSWCACAARTTSLTSSSSRAAPSASCRIFSVGRCIDGLMPTRLQRFVVQELDIRDDAVFIKEGMLGLADTAQLIVAERPDLVFKPLDIRFPERIREFNGDCFAAITSISAGSA